MKKLFLAVFVVGVLFSTGIYLWQSRGDYLPAREVTPEELKDLISQEDSLYVYFFSPTCEDCLQSEPKLARAVAGTSLKIVKVDVKKYQYLRQELEIPGTPSIFYYQNHKLEKGITGGFSSAEEYRKFFRETGGIQ